MKATPHNLKLFLLNFCLLFSLSSCTVNSSDPDTLNMNLGFEPQSLDWQLASDSYSFVVVSNLMIGLTRSSDDGSAVPGCATHWEVSDDNSEYIFHLDPKAKWTDGVPVTAQHFIDAYERLFDPATGAPYADLLSIIDLKRSKAIDDLTLKIKLKRPAAYFLGLTFYGPSLPIRKDIIEKYGDDWTEPENIVTNGPFKLQSWQHEYKIVLERNDDYHQELAKVQNLKFFMVPEQASAFTLFKNGQFDWIDSGSIPNSEMRRFAEREQDFDINQKAILRSTYVGFDLRRKPFDDARVRKAFAYAIDRTVLPKVLNKGEIASARFLPPGLKDYFDSEHGLDYKPELARKLLAEAGYPDGKGFPEIEFLFPSIETAKLLSETLQSMWSKELGITVRLLAQEWKVYLNRLYTDPPHIYRSSWGADYPDPDTFMQIFKSASAINHGKWSNPQYDELVDRAAAISSLPLRQKLYHQAEKLLLDQEMVIAPLFVNSQTILKKHNIKGLAVNPMDIVFLDKVSKE